MSVTIAQWILIAFFGLLFIYLTPKAKTLAQFFEGESQNGKKPNVFLLTSSLIISWIFAKSITNAANLGLSFGIVGGVSYAVYYLSFVVAGVVIYQLRVKGGYKSIHAFLEHRFGNLALVLFSLLISFRLFNEVWSNTMVIGSYFGVPSSMPYYLSILLFTGLTLWYTMKGGMRSSMLTDAIQMVFFGVLLFIILSIMIPSGNRTIAEYFTSGTWSMSTGLNLFFVALIQVFSYPFHDPVMTDRGFITDSKTTLRSYIYAALIGFCCLVLFSLVGVYAQFEGLSGQAPVEVAKLLGTLVMLVMNFIMITSAASTLDSAFSSFSKLAVVDLKLTKSISIRSGRIVMLVVAVSGTLPIFFAPEILSATTVSGTMVLGLAPVFLFWNCKTNKWSFILPVCFGIVTGLLVATGTFPVSWTFTSGKYDVLFAANVYGTVGSFILFFLSLFIKNVGDGES